MRIFVRGGINSYVGNLPFYLQQFWGYEKQTQKHENNMSYFKKHSSQKGGSAAIMNHCLK